MAVTASGLTPGVSMAQPLLARASRCYVARMATLRPQNLKRGLGSAGSKDALTEPTIALICCDHSDRIRLLEKQEFEPRVR